MWCRPLLLACALAFAPAHAAAAESTPARSSRATATLVTAAAAIAPDTPFRLGLRLRLAPGWHTYWRNPGDAGAPPELTLDLPDGGTAGPFEWPAPTRLPFGPLVNFGYTGDVLLPLEVTPPPGLAPGDRFTIMATARWLVCADICVPEEAEFALTLPVAADATPDPRLALAFAAAEATLERPPPGALRATRDGDRLTLAPTGPGWDGDWRDATFFPDAAGAIRNAAPQRWRGDRLELPAADERPTTLAGALVLTATDGTRAAFTVAAPIEIIAAATAPIEGLLLTLALAFAGGLLLNLMPCVFPVLAMKAIGLARLGGAARVAVRAEAGAYTAGVVATALGLGAALISLRAAGTAAGWGFQLTEPVVVAALAWLMLAVGLNLSGVFRVGGAGLVGGGVAARRGPLGAFATGALAVLLATPCTAPFMATALGAALVLPPAAGLAVFGALGIGLAAPYAALAAAPGLARALPKPGAWMTRVQQALAFPMYGAAAWLIWVLAQQVAPTGLALALGGAVLVGFAAWALGAAQASPAAAAGPSGRLGRGAAVVAAGAALALLSGVAAAPPATSPPQAEAWSAARVVTLQAAGRPVFVNLTAAWCLTCIVTERAVLAGADTQAAFAAAGAVQLTGDWTLGDPAVGALLRSLGREGVPLYLLYPPGGGAPVVLPQLLTGSAVRQALAAVTSPRPIAERR